MRALCLITVKPGIIDRVTEALSKKRKITSEIMRQLSHNQTEGEHT